ncbi:hypothetical protein CH63R_14222 [Colletotrichum higginsianum IMI 349063]|uniref:Secreted protein n=1 Tax=Colletotrichum higginsianum (strain IMI 349063) TaxID=759273 RepID=A0A1B7XTB5_COLHI|nr:hypothetical protein CH63R_14222 [Colletotrichum higginsianum IMI 349063]OBR02996.1 hypothetical protein CH63R_14222 [Colletotrichum higginsianum IMI 349063]
MHSQIALVILGSVSVLAAPASVATATEAIFDVDIAAAAAPPPVDIDISQDYPVGAWNFLGNASWSVANREDNLVWVHESRYSTVPVTVEPELAARGIEERTISNQWKIGFGKSSCPSQTRTINRDVCITQPNEPIYAASQAIVYSNTAGYSPKVNYYSGSGCGSYMFSVIGTGTKCANLGNLNVWSYIAFNQQV